MVCPPLSWLSRSWTLSLLIGHRGHSHACRPPDLLIRRDLRSRLLSAHMPLTCWNVGQRCAMTRGVKRCYKAKMRSIGLGNQRRAGRKLAAEHLPPRHNQYMTIAMTDWPLIIFTTLGGGTVGAVVTTFGGQARARRKARAKILKTLRELEVERIEAFEHFDDGEFCLNSDLLADLETRCMLAGVPRFPVRTYRLAYESARMASSSATDATWIHGRPSKRALTSSLMDEAAKHLAASVWHPWLSWLTVQGECSYLRETINLAFPDIRAFDDWPRQTIRRWRRVMVLRRHPPARRRVRKEAEAELVAEPDV